MFDAISHALQDFIGNIGYLGLFILMVLESTFVPVPSVLVMPFAGFMASAAYHGPHPMTLPMVIAMNSLGAIVGSYAFYWFGRKGGKPILLKVGKWFLVKPADIDKTEVYFQKPGRYTVLIARFIPVVRHFISFVAGLGHMRMGPFMLQTFVGATVWGGFLATVGYMLGENWESFVTTFKKFDLVIAGAILLTAVVLYLRWRKKRKAAQAAAPATEIAS